MNWNFIYSYTSGIRQKIWIHCFMLLRRKWVKKRDNDENVLSFVACHHPLIHNGGGSKVRDSVFFQQEDFLNGTFSVVAYSCFWCHCHFSKGFNQCEWNPPIISKAICFPLFFLISNTYIYRKLISFQNDTLTDSLINGTAQKSRMKKLNSSLSINSQSSSKNSDSQSISTVLDSIVLLDDQIYPTPPNTPRPTVMSDQQYIIDASVHIRLAVELEGDKKYEEAFCAYKTAIDILLKHGKGKRWLYLWQITLLQSLFEKICHVAQNI